LTVASATFPCKDRPSCLEKDTPTPHVPPLIRQFSFPPLFVFRPPRGSLACLQYAFFEGRPHLFSFQKLLLLAPPVFNFFTTAPLRSRPTPAFAVSVHLDFSLCESPFDQCVFSFPDVCFSSFFSFFSPDLEPLVEPSGLQKTCLCLKLLFDFSFGPSPRYLPPGQVLWALFFSRRFVTPFFPYRSKTTKGQSCNCLAPVGPTWLPAFLPGVPLIKQAGRCGRSCASPWSCQRRQFWGEVPVGIDLPPRVGVARPKIFVGAPTAASNRSKVVVLVFIIELQHALGHSRGVFPRRLSFPLPR